MKKPFYIVNSFGKDAHNGCSEGVCILDKRLELFKYIKYTYKIKTNCTVIFLYCTNICFCVLTNQHTSTGFCKKKITVMKE